jgi:hypothetical protein
MPLREMARQCLILSRAVEALVGYRLLKANATMYDVGTTAPHGWTCDCPDATFHPERPGGCKHVSALRAALAALAR